MHHLLQKTFAKTQSQFHLPHLHRSGACGPVGGWLLIFLLMSLSTLSWGQQCFNTSTIPLTPTGNSVANPPYAETAGDFNGDGKPDLAVAGGNMIGTVSILLNTGSGSFGPQINYELGFGFIPSDIAVADVNGDGRLDLAVTGTGGNNVAVLLNMGNGTFGAATSYPVGTMPQSIAVGDFNADGKPDLATANQNSGNVSVLLNGGNGTFGAATNFTVSTLPSSIVAGDFNSDGKPDLVVANLNGAISFLPGSGTGTFGSYVYIPLTNLFFVPRQIKAGDFNGDNKLDLALTDHSTNIQILLGNGAGGFGFAPATGGSGGRNGLTIGDFNGDGKADLASTAYSAPTVFIQLGNGDGTFQAATSITVGASPSAILSTDFNGDGKLDLSVINAGATVTVLLGHGDGSFGNTVNNPRYVAVGDFNGDGRPDLAVANRESNNVSILLANGSGGFGGATNFAVGANPRSVAVADFNGDGQLDLAVGNYDDNTVSILLGNGSGGFGMAPNVITGAGPQSVAVADFNSDGKPDLAIANFGANRLQIVYGNGLGGFALAFTTPTGVNPAFIAVGDFNNNGKPDLAIANYGSDNITIVPNAGASTTIAVGNLPYSIVTGDFNGDGKLDLATANRGTNTISVLLGNGDGSFGAITNFGTGTDPVAIAIGDFNTDGKPDLVTANYFSNNVSVLLGNGLGSFGAAIAFGVGSSPFSVAVGDFNADTKQDLVVANLTDNDLSLLLNCTATANTPPSVANAIPNQSGTVGQAFAYTIAANTFTDTETPGSLALSVTGLPAGLSLTGRVISGTATAPGVSTVTVQATDPGSLAVSTTFTITISPAGSMTTVPTGPATLTITSFNCFSTAGALSSVNFVVGYNGGTFTPALPNLFINGVTITGQLGQSYTFGFDANAGPLLVQDNASRATYFVWDYRAACAGGVTPPVAMAPAAPALPNQTATQNSPFSYVVPAFTGTAPITYAATSLPAGLNFNAATRTISGTPTGTGVSTVMLTASNSAGSGSGTFTITVNAATTPPSTPGSLTITNFTCTYTGATLSSVNFVVGYNGGTFTPALPNLFINGVTITGQLGQSYTFGFDANAGPLLVQDNASRATYFVWDYRAACAGGVTPPVAMAPAAPALPNQTATQNSPFSYVVPAFTGTAPITYAATSLPAGLNFNAATRTISGTPTGTGVSTVMLTASNSAGSGSGTFTITVNAATTPPSTPGSLTITNFTCTYTGATLSSVNFVVGYNGGTFTPALPNLFINGVTITGQLGQSYTFGFDANAGPLLVQDNASRATYFVWNYRAACASLASPRIAAEPVTPWAVQLLGNPVRNELVVLISGAQGQSLALELITVAGNVVETRQILPTSAAHKEVFDVQRQSGGLLLLQVMSSTHRETLKVLKQ